MKKQMVKKLLCAVLCTSMLAGLTVNAAAEDAQSDGEVVEITYCGTSPSVIPGVQNTDVAKYIEEKLNIRLNVVNYTAEQWAASLAAGDIPDVFQCNEAYNLKIEDLIQGGQVMELTDLVNEYGPDIQQNIPEVLNYMREYKSNGTGDLYGITTGVIVNNPEASGFATNYSNGVCIRWDYYKELGYPEVTNEDELLDVLKQMQEAHPVTADGLPVYAFSGFSDWGLWSYFTPYSFSNGWMNADGYLVGPNGEIQSMFGEDADVMKKAMFFLNKAYRMGLCDPEMFTMKNSDYVAKLSKLQLLTAAANWWNGDIELAQREQGITDTGFYQIPGAFPIVWEGYYQALGQTDRITAVSANCEHPEAAMKLLNFLSSYEGSRLLMSGIEGVHWDVVDGKKTINEKTLERYRTDSTNFALETGINLYVNMQGLSGSSLDEDGEYLSLFSTLSLDLLSEGDKLFAEHYGKEYPAQVYQAFEEEGKLDIINWDYTAQGFMEPLDNDMSMISTQCNNYYLTLVAQLITSESEEAFNENWETGVATLADMGYDELYDFIKESGAKAVEKYEAIKE